MKLPEWTKPALLGAAGGAIALAVVGFSWGGWMTGGAASALSSKESVVATAAALTPYCLQKSQRDPKLADVLAEIQKASTYQRSRIVEDAGWATPLGTDKPNRDLAEACQIALSKST